MTGCRVSREYERRGTPVVFLENESLRVEILTGKGADVTQIVDKRTDTNVLFESPHEWRLPSEDYENAPDATFSFIDHYPGGWQDILPTAGGPAEIRGAPFATHGESSLLPWEVQNVDRGPSRAEIEVQATLTRYPFTVSRTFSIERGGSTLTVESSVTNNAGLELEYSWLQHIALGEPLISPNAHLDVPCETVLTEPTHDSPNARLPSGETFEWPVCRTECGEEVDLREFPPKDERIHDMVALTDLTDGRYTVTNPDLNLEVEVTFPTDVYTYLWYWQPFRGMEGSPFFGENYNVGLEPCTSFSNAGLEEAMENDTGQVIGPHDSVEATITLTTSEATE